MPAAGGSLTHRALVTGALGFVGRHLTRHLEAAGDEVVRLDRPDGPDLADLEGLTRVFSAHRPEVVYHLAGQADVAASWDHPTETFRVNAEGTLHVLTAARRAGVGRVISVTSADVYGLVTPDELPLTEESPFRPASPYAASKAAADLICLQAHLGHGQDVIRVRAFNHLGPGQSDRFVAGALAARVVAAETDGRTQIAVGDLSARRDFTDVRDVVRAYRLLALSGRPGEAYNVCSGVDHAVSEVAARLVAHATVPLELVTDPDLLRPVDLPVLRGDNTRLRAATGWAPELTLDQTLADLLDDIRSRP